MFNMHYILTYQMTPPPAPAPPFLPSPPPIPSRTAQLTSPGIVPVGMRMSCARAAPRSQTILLARQDGAQVQTIRRTRLGARAAAYYNIILDNILVRHATRAGTRAPKSAAVR